MSTPVEFNPIGSTGVRTFTITKGSSEEIPQVHMVYISKISESGTDITVKALNMENRESLIKAKSIAAQKLIAGITFTSEGYFLSGHESRMPPMSDETQVYLDCNDSTVSLGKLTNSYIVRDNDWKNTYLLNYRTYVLAVKRVLTARKQNSAATKAGE